MGEHLFCENLISEIMQKTKKNRDAAIRIINYTQHAQSIEVLAEQELKTEYAFQIIRYVMISC